MVNPWKTVKENRIYSNKWGYSLRNNDVINPKGVQGTYMVLEAGGPNIIVIASDVEGKYYMLRQWRYPTNEESLEFVAEAGQANEESLDGAKRALREELGGESSDWVDLGFSNVFPGIMKIKTYAFWAKNVVITDSQNDDTEQFEIEKYSLEEVGNKIKSGEITEAASTLAYNKLREYISQTSLTS